jgi:hypothetical protein
MHLARRTRARGASGAAITSRKTRYTLILVALAGAASWIACGRAGDNGPGASDASIETGGNFGSSSGGTLQDAGVVDAAATSEDAEALDGSPGTMDGPTTLALPDANVVWVGVTGGQVYFSLVEEAIARVPADGGMTFLVSPAGYTGDLGAYITNAVTFDSAYVYWSESTATPSLIKRAPLDGGPSQTLASSPGFAASLALASGTVYWVDQYVEDAGGEILSVPVTGGGATVIASGLTVPAGIAVHGGTLYVADAYGDLLSVSTDGGTVTTLVKGPGLTGLPANSVVEAFSISVAVDDSNVYFPQYYASEPNLSVVPLDGGPPTVLLQGYISAFAVDANNLYWLAGSKVNEMPLDGGTVRVLASNQSLSAGPALDEDSVYWGTSESTITCGLCPPGPTGINAVMKVAK